MELSGPVGVIVLLLTPLVIALVVDHCQDLYQICMRLYERNLEEAYFQSFQARSTEARHLNAEVGFALRRAQRAVAEARKVVPDAVETSAALDQIAEWLNSAAATSDRALQSLADRRLPNDEAQTMVFTDDGADQSHQH